MTGRSSVLAGIAVAAVLVSGCGGGEGESGDNAAANPGQAPLTKDEYVKEATTLCLNERQRMSADLEPFFAKLEEGDSSPELVREALEGVVLPGFRVQYEGLRVLTPPWEDADFLDLMLSKFSRAIKNGEEDLDRLFRIKASDYSEFAEGTLMTKEYGIKGCGSLRRSLEAVLEDF